MNRHAPINPAAKSPCSDTAAVPVSPVSGAAATFPCRECDGAGEAEYMALDETRYVWRPCHVCEGSRTEKPYCETCQETLTVDGWCYSCDQYPDGFVYVERLGPGRVAV